MIGEWILLKAKLAAAELEFQNAIQQYREASAKICNYVGENLDAVYLSYQDKVIMVPGEWWDQIHPEPILINLIPVVEVPKCEVENGSAI